MYHLEWIQKDVRYFMKAKIKKDAKKVYEAITKQSVPYVFTFGNGGSCAIANHMEVDWSKNSQGAWVVESLCSNTAMITMIANDYGYDQSCSKQVEWKGLAGSHLVLISSSGNSPNIVNAAKAARFMGMVIIGFTGFDGGWLKEISDVNVHINTKFYEEAEDYHHQVMHEVSRLIRKGRL